MNLTEFVLARVAEDEAMAWRAGPTTGEAPGTDGLYWSPGDDGVERITVDPARVLAECAAKRRIVEWAADVDADYAGAAGPTETLLPLLALPYADHEDYDPAWRP